MKIDANGMHFSALNERVRDCEEREIYIANCVGQRYIGTGLSDKEIAVGGTPGNALGADLNGARIRVYGGRRLSVAMPRRLFFAVREGGELPEIKAVPGPLADGTYRGADGVCVRLLQE